jgi:arthrofactin-type cyclic lipopeptide synthetase B
MIPALLVPLDEFPLTSSGKVDRKSLPDPLERAVAIASPTFEAPAGPVEEMLAAVWRDLLKLDRVGRDDDFFELGGHSLLVMRMSARLRAIGGRGDTPSPFGSLPIHLVFEAPTIRALAERLEAVRMISAPVSPSEHPPESGGEVVF